MTIRTVRSTIAFRRPFYLKKIWRDGQLLKTEFVL
jgi:hypothetical protein